MTYNTSKWSNPESPFSGGYVDNTPSFTLGDSYSPYLRNCRLEGQAIKIRPGHNLFATLTSGDYPRGIGSYLRTVSSNDKIIIRHNQGATEDLVTIAEDGTITAITTGANITSDNRMNFQNVADVIYCMNGVDNFGKLNGTTYTTPATGITNFAPTFSVVFNSSHWTSGWSTNPNILYKSVGNNYEDFASAGSDQFSFEETVTGLATNNKDLFIFSKNNISSIGAGDIQETAGSLTYVTRSLGVKEGSVNHNSIIVAGTNMFYVTPSNRIVRLYKGSNVNGFEVLGLSDRKYKGIDNLMKTLDKDQSDCFGYYLPTEGIIKWFFKRNGSSINDICIIYDTDRDAFLVDEQKYFYGGIAFKGNNYTISMVEEKVYQDEINQDDEDSSIPFEYYTKEFTMGDPTRKKLYRETRTATKINELAELIQEIYVDGVLVNTKQINKDNVLQAKGGIGTFTIGNGAIGTGSNQIEEMQDVSIIRSKGNLNIKGKKIQFRFTCDTLAGKVQLESLSVKLEVLPELTNNLTT